MVGRTNVPQRKAPTINGDVKKFIVASGENIEIGDFVQYKMVEQNKNISPNSCVKYCMRHFSLGENKYLCNDSIHYIVKIVDVSDGYVVKDSVSGSGFWLLDDGKVFIATVNYIRIYEIVDDKFVLLMQKEDNYLSASRLPFVCGQLSEGQLCVFYNTNDATYVCYYGYDSGEIGEELLRQSVYSDTQRFTLGNFASGENNSYVIYGITYSAGYIYGIYCCRFDSASKKHSRQSASSIGTPRVQLASDSGQYSFCPIDKNIFGFFNGYLYVGRVDDYSVSTVMTTTVTSVIPDQTLSASSYSVCFISKNLMLVSVGFGGRGTSKGAFYLVNFDDDMLATSTGNVVLSEEIVYEVTQDSRFLQYFFAPSLCYKGKNGKIFCLYDSRQSGSGGETSIAVGYQGQYLYMLLYKDGTLQIGEESGVVEIYNGGGALGFSKSNGSGGEEISVYVPKISS